MGVEEFGIQILGTEVYLWTVTRHLTTMSFSALVSLTPRVWVSKVLVSVTKEKDTTGWGEVEGKSYRHGDGKRRFFRGEVTTGRVISGWGVSVSLCFVNSRVLTRDSYFPSFCPEPSYFPPPQNVTLSVPQTDTRWQTERFRRIVETWPLASLYYEWRIPWTYVLQFNLYPLTNSGVH